MTVSYRPGTEASSARGVTARIFAGNALTRAEPKEIAILRHARLDFPADLTARKVPLEFQWTPGSPGTYSLRAEIYCAGPEIYLGNNAAFVGCDVQPRP